LCWRDIPFDRKTGSNNNYLSFKLILFATWIFLISISQILALIRNIIIRIYIRLEIYINILELENIVLVCNKISDRRIRPIYLKTIAIQ